nr:uncharacterized protein LOC109181269 [Ipomoea trifida]
MATWPPISSRSTPMDNSTGNPAGTGNPILGNARNPAGSGNPITGSATSEPTATEVTFNSQTHSNPYFLHLNENPALELVSFPLVGSNYHPWARAMSMSLSCKNKLVFVNGTITKPSTDDMEKYLAWERCNNMVVSWIVRTLSPSIGSTVLWIDTTYGVWDDLKRRFSKQDLFRIAEINYEIYQTKQGDSSLNEYFSKQKLLWDELILIKRTPQYGHLRVFGCLAYATTVGPKSKLDARAKKCIFLGYTNGTKGYKVYDLITKELFVSRDVAFYEHVFPLQQDNSSAVGNPQLIFPTMSNDHLEVPEISQFQSQDNSRGEHTPLRNSSFEQPRELHSPNQASSSDEACPSLSEIPEQPGVTSSDSSLPLVTRKSTRQKHPPNYLQDYVCMHRVVPLAGYRWVAPASTMETAPAQERVDLREVKGKGILTELEGINSKGGGEAAVHTSA